LKLFTEATKLDGFFEAASKTELPDFWTLSLIWYSEWNKTYVTEDLVSETFSMQY
jgi:hypothetical protein